MISVTPPLGIKYILFLQNEEGGNSGKLLGRATSVEFVPIPVVSTPPDPDKKPFRHMFEYTKYLTDDGRVFYEYEVCAYIADNDREILRLMIERAGGNAEELLGPQPESKFP